jgi:hypothetical protein
MIASSKITVFPDPVGADSTIDASVKYKTIFVTVIWLHFD